MWTLGLLGAESLRAAGLNPRRLSMAAMLSAARHAARTNPPPRALRLKRAVLDGYRRKGRKTAYRCPHKKSQHAPGAPRLAKATSEQVRRAAALRALEPTP